MLQPSKRDSASTESRLFFPASSPIPPYVTLTALRSFNPSYLTRCGIQKPCSQRPFQTSYRSNAVSRSLAPSVRFKCHAAAMRYPEALLSTSALNVIPQQCGIQKPCSQRLPQTSYRSNAVSRSLAPSARSKCHTAAMWYPEALLPASAPNVIPQQCGIQKPWHSASAPNVIPQQCGIQKPCSQRPFQTSYRSNAVSRSLAPSVRPKCHTAAMRYPEALLPASVSNVIPQQCGIQKPCSQRPFQTSYRSNAVSRSLAPSVRLKCHTATMRYPVALLPAPVLNVIPQQCGIQKQGIQPPF